MRSWKPEDILELLCPHCGAEMELWKDEPVLPCRSCGLDVRNPNIDLGCAEWCASAEQCLGNEVPKSDG